MEEAIINKVAESGLMNPGKSFEALKKIAYVKDKRSKFFLKSL